jgi:PPOX class probable F420-dependent enzyme
MSFELAALPDAVLEFLRERHLGTLTTLSDDGSPHVVPVGFSYDAETRTALVITGGDSVKARHAGRLEAVAALCQVDRARWLTLSGPIGVASEPGVVAEAVRRYAERYRVPRDNPKRVALIIRVESMMGSVR